MEPSGWIEPDDLGHIGILASKDGTQWSVGNYILG